MDIGFGVVSLPSAIDGCLSLYQRIVIAGYYVHDIQDLSTLLQLEQIRFSRLKEEFPLDSSPANVDESSVEGCIRRVLVAVKRDLEEAVLLVEKHTGGNSGIPPDGQLCEETPERKSRFSRLLPKSANTQKGSQPSTPSLHQVSWTLKDRTRLTDLVGYLRQYNDSLQQLAPSQSKNQVDMDVFFLALQDRLGLESMSSLSERPEYQAIARSAAVKLISLELNEDMSPKAASDGDDDKSAEFFIPFSQIERGQRGQSRYVSATLVVGGEIENVVIEWRPRFQTSKSVAQSEARLNRLVQMLKLMRPGQRDQNHDYQRGLGFGALRCLGWTTAVRGDLNQRIGLVFAYPPSATGIPMSLKERIMMNVPNRGGPRTQSTSYRDDVPSLGARFRLAEQLAQIFGMLLTAECLHKGLRSDNIFLFSKGQINSPFLAGFTEARPNQNSDNKGEIDPSSNLDDTDEDYKRYRPFRPSSEAGENPHWSPYADLYGLGVILLEIGLWKPVELIQGKATLEELHCKLIPRAVDSLPYRVGDIYFNAVKTCFATGEKWLEGKDSDSEVQDTEDLWFEFSQGVIRQLARCHA